MQSKICSKCKIPKTLDCFYKDKQVIDGISGVCKECRKKYQDSISKEKKSKYRNSVSKEKKEKKAKWQNNYFKTEKGKLARRSASKKYSSSEAGKLVKKKRNANRVKNLSESYVKGTISQGKFSPKIIPAELVELKRISILIKRELKK